MPFDSLPTEPLTDIEAAARDDLHRWCDRLPDRVPALLSAAREGRMDGSQFQGECRCVIGTLGTARECFINEMATIVFGGRLERNYKDPIENYFLKIRPGFTPANSPTMAHVERWIVQWQMAQ